MNLILKSWLVPTLTMLALLLACRVTLAEDWFTKDLPAKVDANKDDIESLKGRVTVLEGEVRKQADLEPKEVKAVPKRTANVPQTKTVTRYRTEKVCHGNYCTYQRVPYTVEVPIETATPGIASQGQVSRSGVGRDAFTDCGNPDCTCEDCDCPSSYPEFPERSYGPAPVYMEPVYHERKVFRAKRGLLQKWFGK